MQDNDKIRLQPTSPENIKHDWIAPPDSMSSIRLVKYHIPKDETALQKQYRLRRGEVQAWNHAFWAKHNRNFQQVVTVNILITHLCAYVQLL